MIKCYLSWDLPSSKDTFSQLSQRSPSLSSTTLTLSPRSSSIRVFIPWIHQPLGTLHISLFMFHICSSPFSNSFQRYASMLFVLRSFKCFISSLSDLHEPQAPELATWPHQVMLYKLLKQHRSASHTAVPQWTWRHDVSSKSSNDNLFGDENN